MEILISAMISIGKILIAAIALIGVDRWGRGRPDNPSGFW
jgi:hypothetical protein